MPSLPVPKLTRLSLSYLQYFIFIMCFIITKFFHIQDFISLNNSVLFFPLFTIDKNEENRCWLFPKSSRLVVNGFSYLILRVLRLRLTLLLLPIGPVSLDNRFILKKKMSLGNSDIVWTSWNIITQTWMIKPTTHLGYLIQIIRPMLYIWPKIDQNWN